MSERLIQPGEYQHEAGPKYSVLGLASLVTELLPNEYYIRVGDALSVAGYEETHEVSGYPIAVYKVDDVENLVFIKSEENIPEEVELPDKVVVYEQLSQGAYPEGQLWWRPEENFNQHFAPLESQT